MSTAFLQDLSKKSSFSRFKTVGEFRDKVIQTAKKSGNLLNESSLQNACCEILTKLIEDKLTASQKANKWKISPKDLKERLEHYKSHKWRDVFSSSLPSWTKYGKKSVGYSSFLNDMFGFVLKDPRDKLEGKNPWDQCLAARKEKRDEVVQLQKAGTLICYFCGRPITSAHKTANCEHKLPVISACAHYALCINYKEMSDDEKEAIINEYDWSHHCCNMLKTMYDIVYYEPYNPSVQGSGLYKCNKDMIRDLLTVIKNSREHDCQLISGTINIPLQIERVCASMQPILDTINYNIGQCTTTTCGDPVQNEKNGRALYTLFTIFKIVCIFGNDIRTLQGLQRGGSRKSNGGSRSRSRSRSRDKKGSSSGSSGTSGSSKRTRKIKGKKSIKRKSRLSRYIPDLSTIDSINEDLDIHDSIQLERAIEENISNRYPTKTIFSQFVPGATRTYFGDESFSLKRQKSIDPGELAPYSKTSGFFPRTEEGRSFVTRFDRDVKEVKHIRPFKVKGNRHEKSSGLFRHSESPL